MPWQLMYLGDIIQKDCKYCQYNIPKIQWLLIHLGHTNTTVLVSVCYHQVPVLMPVPSDSTVMSCSLPSTLQLALLSVARATSQDGGYGDENVTA